MVSCKSPGALLRSMFTFPTKPVMPAFSSSSIKMSVASVWREENMHTRVVPQAAKSRESRR